jgi:hypothetical protein
MDISLPTRLNFFVDSDRRVITYRPIGPMLGPVYIASLFEAYAKLEAPWTYSRLADLRRFTGVLSEDDIQDAARRWAALTAGQNYHSHVAVVSLDAWDLVRIPVASKHFPNETICMFTDFHEANGWLTATDKTQYLTHARKVPVSPRMNDQILIQAA